MTQKRKAEIQRKLSLARVPEPPAGLEERIKADIPRYLLERQHERARLNRWMSISLRAAAAVLLLVTSTVALVQLFSETDPSTMDKSAPPVIERPRAQISNSPAFASPSEPAVQTTAMPSAAAGAAPVELAQLRRSATQRRAVRTASTSRSRSETYDEMVVAPAPPPPPPSMVAPAGALADSNVAAESAPAAESAAGDALKSLPPVVQTAPAAPRAVEPQPQPQPQRDRERERRSMRAPDHLFGISADPAAFGRIKRAIEAGERPSSTDVDVEALINYFAGAAQRRRGRLSLDVEGSPAPVGAANTIMLRFTVDTGNARGDQSTHAAAIDARIDIELDGDAIASYRRIGGRDSTSAAENMLMKNASVTGLYELELKPRLRTRQRIATVRLRYRLTPGGREHVIERIVRAGAVAPTWMTASRRHRLASLGAVWGESLQSAARATEVARKAEELAVKEPKDERAKELAEAATASSRL